MYDGSECIDFVLDQHVYEDYGDYSQDLNIVELICEVKMIFMMDELMGGCVDLLMGGCVDLLMGAWMGRRVIYYYNNL